MFISSLCMIVILCMYFLPFVLAIFLPWQVHIAVFVAAIIFVLVKKDYEHGIGSLGSKYITIYHVLAVSFTATPIIGIYYLFFWSLSGVLFGPILKLLTNKNI
jgi:hypothetical protein